MEVIKGGFGGGSKPPERVLASDIFQAWSDHCSELEDSGINAEIAIVVFVNDEMLEVSSNVEYPDKAFTLLSMGTHSLMNQVLGTYGDD